MTTTLIALLVVALLLAAFRLWSTANRLHRLHVRTEAAWVALDGALTRRSVCARALAAAGGLGAEHAALLRGLARHTDNTGRAQRAHAEDELTRGLARLPITPSTPASLDLLAELADAQERVDLARSFYNDAVRDARALRDKGFTKFFRLAGSAAMPQYFEMDEIPIPAIVGRAPTLDYTKPRRSGRVVLLDENDKVLLLHGHDPAAPDEGFWFTPGGGLEDGETLEECAARELFEETGLQVHPAEFGGPLWIRRVQFSFDGEELDSQEVFYVLRTRHADVPLDRTGHTELERATIDELRWFSPEELTSSADQIYPLELASRIHEAVAIRHAVLGHPQLIT